MIKNGKRILFIGILVIAVAGVFFIKKEKTPGAEMISEISPVIGTIQSTVTSTAVVQPQNRLEIKPPINGRIERILVKEGQKVKAGEIIAWMSSTERAALLDAARARGLDAVKYWEEVYKSTPLISPIDGEVIVSTDEPGQTVTSSDVVMVLSDKLIVQAQVDETDVGRIAIGQEALISLDAYPQIKVNGKVDHIYYESKTVNNVTIYQVDILPETVPSVFRSGMSATVTIKEAAKDKVLIVPLDAVKRKRDGVYVTLSRKDGKKPIETKVELGISDEKNVEIISGLKENDKIVIVTQKYDISSGVPAGRNPFMPAPKKRQ